MKLKRVFAAVTAFAMCAALAGCGAEAAVSESAAESAVESAVEAAPETEETADAAATEAALRIAGLKGPTTMGLVNLMSDEVASSYDFTMYGAADEIVPLLVKGELDAAAVPANLAATLYNKTNGAVEVACINTLGVLYIVENGDTVNSVGDLKGQTIVTTGKGATPEYVLRYVLSENGIDPDKDVTLEYTSEATEALSKVQAGEANIAMLPQPFVTSALSQVEGLRVALDMNEEWQKVAGSKLVTGVLVVRKDAVENDPEAFAAFMDGYKASVEAANNDVEGTAALCEQYGVVAKAALAQKALPQCNIVFETGDEMKNDLATYFNVLYAADPASVGGSLPTAGGDASIRPCKRRCGKKPPPSLHGLEFGNLLLWVWGMAGCFWPRPCRHWGRWQHWRLPLRSGSASCSAHCAYWRAFCWQRQGACCSVQQGRAGIGYGCSLTLPCSLYAPCL